MEKSKTANRYSAEVRSPLPLAEKEQAPRLERHRDELVRRYTNHYPGKRPEVGSSAETSIRDDASRTT